MNLPDFSKHVGLNQLRQNMGTELISWNSGGVWDVINIDKILEKTGIDIPPGDLEYAADGTLEYEGRKVVVYIRDQYVPSDSNREQLCKFHVADCVTLQGMRQSNRYERYVVTTRTDGKFIVNFLGESWYRDKEEEVERRLYVCKNCLSRLNYNGYKSYGYSGYGQRKKNAIRESFDLREFFERYGSQITREPTHTDITAPLNTYPPNWNQISHRYKEKRNWECEECGINLRDERKFLHVHHINGQKNNNNDKNLLSLCIGCHANKPQHHQLRSHPDYWEYMRWFNQKEFNIPF